MKMICVALSLILTCLSSVHGATPTTDLYWVYLTDKEGDCFDPKEYFHPAAQMRRERLGLPAFDQRDLPLTPSYLQIISETVDSIRHQLRWINAVTVHATEAQINQVATFPFVQEIKPFRFSPQLSSHTPELPPSDSSRFDTLLSLTRDLMQLDVLEKQNITGAGIRIAILDAGFKEADTHLALAYVRSRKGVVAVKDFYDGDEEVYHHSMHGTEVMSCVAGMYGDRQMGCAKDADFLLARIEHERKEKPIEEDHWLAAIEWADRMGADLVNSSVTYTSKRYTYSDMDGESTPVSKAAKIATEKGMLVICSMGNDGTKDWRYLGAPADVPEVVSVGGSVPFMPKYISFSSLGPNAKKHTKPDVSAPAFVLSAVKKGEIAENQGTSFATPLITGLAACLLQLDSTQTPAKLAKSLRKLGHFYPYFDYELGYGVPKVGKLFQQHAAQSYPRFRVFHRSDSVILAMDTSFLRRDSLHFPNGRMLHFHLQSKDGPLLSHQAVRIPNDTQYYFFRRRQGIYGTLRIWLGGYLYEEEILN